MWHGGIQPTETLAPGSVPKAKTMDSAVSLECMADREVIAWSLNKDYQKNTYNGQILTVFNNFCAGEIDL